MGSRKKFALTVLAALLAVGGGARADAPIVDQNAKTKRGFVLMQAEMTNPDAFFTKYAVPAEVEVAAHGGAAQVATFDKRVVEGRWDNNWTIILAFPSLAAATTWYNSPGYQKVIPERHAATAYGNMVMFEGAPESVVKWSISQYEGVQPKLRFPLTLDPTPEFIVTAVPDWKSAGARFIVRAGFAEADIRGARLSLDLKLADAYLDDDQLAARVSVVDAAGRRSFVGHVEARQFSAGQWASFEFPSGASARSRGHGAEYADPAHATAVEIEFVAHRKPVAAGDIAVRNLKIGH